MFKSFYSKVSGAGRQPTANAVHSWFSVYATKALVTRYYDAFRYLQKTLPHHVFTPYRWLAFASFRPVRGIAQQHQHTIKGRPLLPKGIMMPAPSCPVCTETGTTLFWSDEKRSYWRCPRCQATFMDPAQRPDTAFERAYYQTHQNDVNDAGYRRYLSPLIPPLLERLAQHSHGLDYGCGPGPALAAMLTEAGHTMALYDPQFCNTPQVLQTTYDFVTCSEVAEHFHNPEAEFTRLDALLKPGGWLAVMTRFLEDDSGFERWHYRRDPTHVVFYKAATFTFIAQAHGWHCEIPCSHVALFQKPA